MEDSLFNEHSSVATIQFPTVQTELWQMTDDLQHAIIGAVFAHLKRPIQTEISQALITTLSTNLASPDDFFTNPLATHLYKYILYRLGYKMNKDRTLFNWRETMAR